MPTVPMFIRRQLLPLLANLKLAIALLLVIACASILGTVIEQGESVAFYQQNYPLKPALFGFLSYKVILTLGLNQVYHSWWYLCLLMLLAGSLLACTIHRQIPLLKVANRWHFYRQPENIRKLPVTRELQNTTIEHLAEQLRCRGYRVFSSSTGQLYARKGIIGRIAPIVVHISIIIILLGGVWGAFAGFSTQVLLPSGTSTNLEIPKHDWQVRVNHFWIDYTPAGKIDQFYSDLSILDRDNHELTRKTIHVNEPLRYQGVTFYQASWDISAIRFQVNRSPIFQLPLQKLSAKTNSSTVWGTWLPTKPDLSEGITLVTADLQGTFVIYGQDGKILTSIHTNQTQNINGVNLTIKEVIGATGLQIKSDPSVPLVYTGFALLMLSTIASYLSYSQVWAIQQGDTILIGGKTNRAQLQFTDEIQHLLST
ncbi:MAG: cytochrome c biogenesis protein [Pseudanabaenaceae cyanobacterium]